jgi:hypothetical protein
MMDGFELVLKIYLSIFFLAGAAAACGLWWILS